MPEGKERERCDVCGEDCLVEAGSFFVPLGDVVTGQPIAGACCGVCGPKVNAFCDGECKDTDLLPDGPLKGYLRRNLRLAQGERCLDMVMWLADHCATAEFGREDLVAGQPADKVRLTATVNGESRTVTCRTLDEAIVRVMAGRTDG